MRTDPPAGPLLLRIALAAGVAPNTVKRALTGVPLRFPKNARAIAQALADHGFGEHAIVVAHANQLDPTKGPIA